MEIVETAKNHVDHIDFYQSFITKLPFSKFRQSGCHECNIKQGKTEQNRTPVALKLISNLMLGVKKKESHEGYTYHIETKGSKEP